MQTRLHWRTASLLILFTASCTGTSATRTIPLLPGDGDQNTDKPRAVVEDRPSDQPWGDPDKLIRLPDPTPARNLALPSIESFKLKNGLEVLLIPDRTAPVASFQLAIKAGREGGKRSTVGLARLTAVLTTRGTRTRNAAAIVKLVEGANGDLTADASYEATLLSCNSVSIKASACATILADIAANATFPATAFKDLQARLRNSAAQRVRDASSLAAANFQNVLWGGKHPRGWPTSQRSIAATTRANVLAWYRRYYRPNNAILAVSGDFDPKAMKQTVERSFARWAKGKVAATATPKAPERAGIQVRIVDKPDERVAQIRMGQLGLTASDPDFHATQIVNAVLGGVPVGSRLESGLAGVGEITARSQLDSNRALGSWVVSAAAPAVDAVAVVQRVRDTMTKLAADGPTEEETTLARAYLAGNYATRFQSVADVAGAVLAARLHSKAASEVAAYPVQLEAVTHGQVVAAAKKRLDPNNLAVVIVGPATEIAPALDRAGWKYEVTSFVDPVAPWDRKGAEDDGRKVLTAALKAKGGEKALRGLKSFEMVGKALISVEKERANVTKRFATPDKVRHDMEVPSQKTTITSAMNGSSGWAAQKTPQGARVIEFPAGEVEAGKAQIWRDQDLILLRHLEKGAQVAVVDEIEVDGKAAWAVRLVSPDRRYSVVIYVNKATNLLAGMSYQERGQNGVIVAEERYSKYKRIGGIQFAHVRTTQSGPLDMKTEFSSVTVNKAIDDSVFVKPTK